MSYFCICIKISLFIYKWYEQHRGYNTMNMLWY